MLNVRTCGVFQIMHLLNAQYHAFCPQQKDMQVYFLYHRIQSECHIHHEANRKPQFLQVQLTGCEQKVLKRQNQKYCHRLSVPWRMHNIRLLSLFQNVHTLPFQASVQRFHFHVKQVFFLKYPDL